MPLRNGHGKGAGVPRVDVLAADETAGADHRVPRLPINSRSDDPREGFDLLTGRNASSCQWWGAGPARALPAT